MKWNAKQRVMASQEQTVAPAGSAQASAPDPLSERFDVAVIGAGVVGCAIARRFVLEGAKVCVIEKARDVLDGASKGNSGILHTGFDAPPGSLEQACIAAGYGEYLAIRDELGLALRKTGAMVLAWSGAEAERLAGLMDTAHTNGVVVEPLTRAAVLTREPHLAPQVAGGFLVAGEHIIDPWSAPHAYLLQALVNGAALLRGASVERGTRDGGWRLATTAGVVRADTVINCAGLWGDAVDRALGGGGGFTIRPRKGQFVVFDKRAAELVRTILLPVPSATTKGIVICPTAYGNLLVGPTAEEQDSRTDASVDHATLEMLRAKAVEMVPALAGVEVTATYAGIRPATEHKDYQITADAGRRTITVGGIRSTGLSAALGIARHVFGLYEGFGARHAPLAAPAVPRLRPIAETGRRDYTVPGNGGIVCHCELVTRREVEDALRGPLAARTLAGLKRRTRVTMGRCQGFYCLGALSEITAGRLEVPLAEPTAAGPG